MSVQIRTIRRGSVGDPVELWQAWMRGRNDYHGVVDGIFGPATESATRHAQRSLGVETDGVVGNQTWGAAMRAGLEIIADDKEDTKSANWPPRPLALQPINQATRQKLFGAFEFTPAPRAGNPEGIQITSKPEKFRLVKVTLPLSGVAYSPPDGEVLFHELGALRLASLFDEWQREGLLERIETWAGTYVPRFVRGSRTTLSSHAWGTAFDINAAWNGLGRRPELVGKRGSVRELVPAANRHGFYWGGHFKRPDGMHFELVEV